MSTVRRIPIEVVKHVVLCKTRGTEFPNEVFWIRCNHCQKMDKLPHAFDPAFESIGDAFEREHKQCKIPDAGTLGLPMFEDK